MRKSRIKHKITTRQENGEPVTSVYRSLIRHTAQITLEYEQVSVPCVISVLITDDEGIREYNRKYRAVNKPTDVLSFPMQYFLNPGWQGIYNIDTDLDTKTVPLGDIVLSLDTIRRNARKYRYTFEKETARMIIHSCMHLLGYDHSDDMQGREAEIINHLGYFC